MNPDFRTILATLVVGSTFGGSTVTGCNCLGPSMTSSSSGCSLESTANCSHDGDSACWACGSTYTSASCCIYSSTSCSTSSCATYTSTSCCTYSSSSCSTSTCAPVCSDPGSTAYVGTLAVAQELPIPTGGAITNGSYKLTAVKLYTGPGGASGLQNGLTGWHLVISASLFWSHLAVQGAIFATFVTDGTITTSGTDMVLANACPDAAQTTYPYTSIPGSQLLLYDAAARTEYTFTYLP